MTNVNYFIFIYFQEQKSVKPHTSVEVSTEDTSTEPQTVSVYDNVYSKRHYYITTLIITTQLFYKCFLCVRFNISLYFQNTSTQHDHIESASLENKATPSSVSIYDNDNVYKRHM